MNDLISRQAAIDAMEKCIMDCNPDHFVSCSKFIEYMHNADIGSFGQWQFANGFNMGVTASKVAINVLQSEQPEHKRGTWIHDGVKRICPFCKDFIVTGRSTVKYCWNCGARLEERSEDGSQN